MSEARRARLQELLADRALWGLEANEERELQDLLSELELSEDETLDSWDLSAGLVAGALLDEREGEMPEHLVQALEADAMQFLSEGSGQGGDPIELGPRSESPAPSPASPPTRSWAGWLVAAAAILLCAFLLYDRGREADPRTPHEARTTLIASAQDLLRMDWGEGPSELRGSPRGDVVWSDEAQRGFMRFEGLRPNDPTEAQYQLWIFDKQRDLEQPVDGGVFDMPAGEGEVVISIDAKILVKDAFAFAVTLEEPGGVVVSEREHIVVAAGL